MVQYITHGSANASGKDGGGRFQVGFKCCGALDYALRQGILHRDIKPANILLAHGTEIRISDFGAAFLRKSHALSGMNFGSPAYMSPEQISGRPSTWSFGLLRIESGETNIFSHITVPHGWHG